MEIYIRFLMAFGFVCAGLLLYFLKSRVSRLEKRVSDLEAFQEAYIKEHLEDHIEEKYKGL